MKWIWLFVLFSSQVGIAGTLPSKVNLGTYDMPPWVDRKVADAGIIARIVERAWALSAAQTELFWIPWKRLFQQFPHQLPLHAAFPMGISEERSRAFIFSDALVQLDRVACHRSDQPFEGTSPADFYGKTIGLRRGAWFGALHTQLLHQNRARFMESDSDLSMIKMLMAKRIDLFFCQPREMRQSVDQLMQDGSLPPDTLQQISMSGRPIFSGTLHVGFPRLDTEGQLNEMSLQLRDRFNLGLSRLKRKEPELFRFPQH